MRGQGGTGYLQHQVVHWGAQHDGASWKVGLLQQVGKYRLVVWASRSQHQMLQLLSYVAAHIPGHYMPVAAGA